MRLSLLAVAALADHAVADVDVDNVNIALLVRNAGYPVADADVTFVDTSETLATDDTGYAFFGYPRGEPLYYPKGTPFNISIPALGLNNQYLTPSCFECEDYEVAAVYVDVESDDGRRNLRKNIFVDEVPIVTEPTVYTTEKASTKPTEIVTAITASPKPTCLKDRRLEDIDHELALPADHNRGLQAVPPSDPPQGPYRRPPRGCGTYKWRLEKHVDLPCEHPNGAELVCTTYINGTPSGKKSLDEEKCSEVQIEAEITSEASSGIGNLGVKVGAKVGATRKLTSCFKVTTTIGENPLPGKCGEICVRTKLKKITLRKWKNVCYCDENRVWWSVWAPTGVLKDYEIATGYCDDTSALEDCKKKKKL